MALRLSPAVPIFAAMIYTPETIAQAAPGSVVVYDEGPDEKYRYTVGTWSGRDVEAVPGWGYSSWSDPEKAEERAAQIRGGAEGPLARLERKR